MWLTRASILRPLFIAMVISAIVVMGLVSYTRLGVDLFPAINFPVVSVFVAYPGASAESVETLVTKPIEDSLAGLNNLDFMQSISSEGQSIAVLIFTEKANPDSASIDVLHKINAIRSRLPKDTLTPNLVKADINALPILNISLSGNAPPAELFRLADEVVAARLKTVDGVAAVDVVGGRQQEIRVKVDQEKLAAHRLSILQVIATLQQDNLNVPSGSLIEAGKEFGVRVNTLAATPATLASLVIADTPAGPVRLNDVATVENTLKQQVRINRTDLKDSIGIQITKQATANTLKVADEIKAEMKQLQAELPAGVSMSIVSDASIFTRQSLNGVRDNLIEAIILTGLVLLLFLHTWRSTLVVLLSIPTSLMATFAMMYAFGFTLNMMSMMGLALVVGILVDDSIVVLENIFRHLQLGDTPLSAALNGRSEIGLAAIAITLVDVVVFLPVAFMSGIVGQYFRQFGLVVAAATLVSLFISFTLTPMLASRWFTGQEKLGDSIFAKFGRAWEAGFERLKIAYTGTLGWSLRHRFLVILVGALSFGVGVGMVIFGLVSTEFLPNADQNEFTIVAEMPAGTTLADTDRAVAKLEEQLATWPEIDNLFTYVGVGDSVNAPSSRLARVQVNLINKNERRASAEELAGRIRELDGTIPGLKLRAQLPTIAGPSGQPIQIRVRGDDATKLDELAGQVEAIVRNTTGTMDIRNSGESGKPELEITLNRQLVANLGLTSAQVASTVRSSLAGNVATQYRPAEGAEVDVRVVAIDEDNASMEAVKAIPLVAPTGAVIRLDQIASVENRSGPPQINRYNRQRLITISAGASGRALGDVTNDLQQAFYRMVVPPGYSVSFGGATQAQQETFAQLYQALGLSVILIYMLMVALYENLLYPFVILLSLPLAVVGAIGALLITGNTLNMMSMIGMILLTGLVGKNAILLIDYTNTLRIRGYQREQALLEAGPVRLRPILMTTATMVVALMPSALKLSESAELRSPLAIVVIGGLLTSTLLTLLMIPAMYTVFDDLQSVVRRRIFGMREDQSRAFRPVQSLEPIAGSAPEGDKGATTR